MTATTNCALWRTTVLSVSIIVTFFVLAANDVVAKGTDDPLKPITQDEKIGAAFLAGMAIAGAFVWYVTWKESRRGRRNAMRRVKVPAGNDERDGEHG